MSKAKMQAAKELIQGKEYDQARAILKTVDHPTAREWEAKLDRIASPAKVTGRKPGKIFRIVLLIVLIAVGVAGILYLRDLNNVTYHYASEALAQNRTRISLSHYCENVSGRSKGDCERWATTVIGQRSAQATACGDEYDWIRDTTRYSLCLLLEGIAVLGSSPIITPVDVDSFTDTDTKLIGAMHAHCDDTASSDYCDVWAFLVYRRWAADIQRCWNTEYVQRQTILGFYDCVDAKGLYPGNSLIL